MKELLLILFVVISIQFYFLTFKRISRFELSKKTKFLLVYLTLVLPIVGYLLVSRRSR